MTIRVVSWNMNSWQRKPEERSAAWLYLRERLAPDIALLQEAIAPPDAHASVFRDFGSPYHKWGTAVVSFNPALKLIEVERCPVTAYVRQGHIEDSQPGTSAVATITLPNGGQFVAISLYGAMEKGGNGIRYATTTVHRVLSDLTPLLDSGREHRPVILAGDFNCSTQMEPPDRAPHEAVFARLAAFGLTDWSQATAHERARLSNCFCAQAGGCSHQRTLRHNNTADSRPWQVDYVFSHHLEPHAGELAVVDDPGAWALSDHAPLMFTVSI